MNSVHRLVSTPWTPQLGPWASPRLGRIRRLSATLAISAALAISTSFGLPGEAAAVVPGQAAPDFTLNDVNGTPFTLSANRGKVVLLVLAGYD